MGELGWTLGRWKDSTLHEFNLACAGYWRNWERFAAVPMREICYVNIAGNPNIKQSSKPSSAREYMKLSIDGEIEKKILPTKEEIEAIRKKVWDGKAETGSGTGVKQ